MANVTPSQRLAALHSAKHLLSGEQGSTILGKTSMAAPKALPMIRLAEYILTGNDYRDVEELRPATHVTPADADDRPVTDQHFDDTGCDSSLHPEDCLAGPPLVREDGTRVWVTDQDGAL